ncbi:MAG: EF-P beta-lysylation protein EpmB [Gammaproteobacteria bacterium]|nr:EF-P beta-lysylation protein EpmB [Gammaproteobacteria bacterium]
MAQPVKLTAKVTASPTLHPLTDAAWKKELSNAITSPSVLLNRLGLESYLSKIDNHSAFKCLVTESFINKIEPGNINDPLLRQILPLNEENSAIAQQDGITDPVGDINAMASPGLLHKYHGRALLISTGACAVHCRYCFRRHYPYQQSSCASNAVDDAIDYLKRHREIEEIILSGGDPLVLDNTKLARLIAKLETAPQLKTLRIHTRLPVVLPNRINQELLKLLTASRFQVVMIIHANHANELQHDEFTKLNQLHNAGIVLLNQSVLLKGINDNADTLVELSNRLLECKTLPYYLHLLDPVAGAMHFSVNETSALALKKQLEESLPGYLVPKLVREIKGKQSKTAISSI